MSNLVVGSRGFIGSYLMKELKADEMDLKLSLDVRNGIRLKYKTIVFLACNQINTLEAYNYNYEMYLALNDYRLKHPKTHLIYISSAAVYDMRDKYAQSKLMGEVYAKKFKNHTILRLSNVYGHGDGHGAPDKFQRGENIINGDGRQIRDLVPVETVVQEIVKHLENPQYGTFNVSTGKGTSVNEMFKLFGEGTPEYNKDADFGVFNSVLKPGRVND